MTMSLYDVLTLKYPDIKIGYDQEVVLANHMDGQGDVIMEWNYQGAPQPTKEEIEAMKVEPHIHAGFIAKKNEHANDAVLKKLDEIDLRSIRALRSGDTEYLAQLEAEAVALRAQLLPMTAARVMALK